MKVRCIVKNSIWIDFGKIYEVQGEEHGLFAIIDESGECYLYGKENFEIIK